jgi:hypothetical protein
MIAAAQFTELILHNNDIYENYDYALGYYHNTDVSINATNNYWGHASGPFHETLNPGGQGDSVSTEVETILPFSTTPHTPWRAPTVPELASPPDSAVLEAMPVLFAWHASIDENEGDTLYYTLEISDEPAFENPLVYHARTDTVFEVDDLDVNQAWYWRTTVRDTTWLKRWSQEERVLLPAMAAGKGNSIVQPHRFAIERAWPNPFNCALHVRLALPHADRVEIVLYDITGRRAWGSGPQSYSSGRHDVQLAPSSLSSGVYFAVLRASHGHCDARKVVLLK